MLVRNMLQHILKLYITLSLISYLKIDLQKSVERRVVEKWLVNWFCKLPLSGSELQKLSVIIIVIVTFHVKSQFPCMFSNSFKFSLILGQI